jgi:hypothetical protein
MATNNSASQTLRVTPIAPVLWLGAAICGIACLYYLLVRVDLPPGPTDAGPVHCGSAISPGPGYDSEGGDCYGEITWHRNAGGLLGAGCVLLLGSGLGAEAARRRRAGRKD